MSKNRTSHSNRFHRSRGFHTLSHCLSIVLVLLACSPVLLAQASPQRIVSTAPSITETLFALGLGDKVVGVSRYCNYPPQVQQLPKVGSYLKPDAEAIARLSPDLVVLQRTPDQLMDRLNALHIHFVQTPHGTLDDVFHEIKIVGDAAGVPDRSTALIAQIQGRLAAIQARAKAVPLPRVLVIVGRLPGTLDDLVATGPDNYVNQLITIAGGTNVLKEQGLAQYPRISLETVLRENPDVIIDLSGTQETEAERKAALAATLALWAQHPEIAAVRNGHVYAGTSNSLIVPGPRTPLAAQQFYDFVHGIRGAE